MPFDQNKKSLVALIESSFSPSIVHTCRHFDFSFKKYHATMKIVHAIVICRLVVSLFLVRQILAFTEDERIAEYHARNFTWPIPEFQPNTEGWDRLMRHRLRQVEEIKDKSERFEGFAQTLSAALIQPNYTQVRYSVKKRR